MPARPSKSRAPSDHPFKELVEALLASRDAGVRPGDPGAFEQFMGSGAAGFMGGGALGTLKGLTGVEGLAVSFGSKLNQRFPQFDPIGGVSDPRTDAVLKLLRRGLGQKRQAANDPRPTPGPGVTPNRGVKPSDEELFEMARRVQRAPEDARSFEQFMKAVKAIFDDL